MYSQVRHADKLAQENYNCARCGYVYISITSIKVNNSVAIQVMECNRCGYLWKEMWGTTHVAVFHGRISYFKG